MNRITTRLKRYGCLLLCICLLGAVAAGAQPPAAGFLCRASCMVSEFRLQHHLRKRRTQRLRLRISAVRRRIYRLDLSLHPKQTGRIHQEHAAKGEIDLMAAPTPRGRAQTMLFSDLPMGRGKILPV